MKILVLIASYLNKDNCDNNVNMYFHNRNLYYMANDIDVTVLNFSSKNKYVVDGVKVITIRDYLCNKDKYDVCILHAPNIRNHFLFLILQEHKFKKLVFIFHGQEIVNIRKSYPSPYEYVKTSMFKKITRTLYDNLKLKIWYYYLPSLIYKSSYIFVSNNLRKDFVNWVGINKLSFVCKTYIINNSIAKVFEQQQYNINSNKIYDFVTIRTNFDASCYALDFINKLAKYNDQLNFLIVGVGKFFIYNKKADNIKLINTILNYNDIIKYLNMSKCALMPTRRDSQGVMSCEMASYGIPLITSDIPICHENFDEFANVAYIKNDEIIDLYPILNLLIDRQPSNINDKFYQINTIAKEVDIIKNKN